MQYVSLNRVFICLFVSKLILLLLQRVHEAMNKPGVSAKLKDVLRQVSTYDNVPRKKAKFQVGVASVRTNECFIH